MVTAGVSLKVSKSPNIPCTYLVSNCVVKSVFTFNNKDHEALSTTLDMAATHSVFCFFTLKGPMRLKDFAAKTDCLILKVRGHTCVLKKP